MKRIFTLLLFLTGIFVNAQNTQPQIEWAKTLGHPHNDGSGSWDILLLDDGGYIVAGTLFEGDAETWEGESDYWVFKLDAAGEITWQKTYGGSAQEQSKRISKAQGGGYFIAGESTSNDGDVGGHYGSSYYRDWWVIKIDEAGEIIWEKNLGGAADEFMYDGFATEDGGFICVGQTASIDGDVVGNHNATGYTSDGWVVKLDAAGNIDWQKCYGGFGGTGLIGIDATPDGGYVIVGETEALGGDVPLQPYPVMAKLDAWVIKTDATGNIEWSQLYGGSEMDGFSSLELTESGGYIMTGFTDSADGDISFNHTVPSMAWAKRDVWVVEIDATGELLWEKTYGGTGNEMAYQIRATADCGYALTGNFFSTIFEGQPLTVNENGYSGGTDGFLMKIDLVGEIAWVQTMGGSQQDLIWNFTLTPDGGYITAGGTNSDDGDAVGNNTLYGWYELWPGYSEWLGTFDNWIIKLGPDCEVPEFTTDALVDVCNGGDVTLTVATTGNKISWYDSANATEPVFTGASFALTNVTANASYWVEVANCRCVSPRTQVSVTVNAIPVVTAQDATACTGSAATITAASAGNTINWYATETETNILFTGTDYTTPVLTANTSYWAEAVSPEGCISDRVEVAVTINALPVVTAQNTTTCEGSAATVTAASAGNTINWYSSETATEILFTGTEYTTPALTAATSYWVEAVSPEGCISDRVEVAVTLNAPPSVTIQNAQACTGSAAVLTASSAGNTINWYSSQTSTEVLFAGTEYTTPVLSAATSYWAEAISPQGCISARTEVMVTVNPLPVVSAQDTDITICEGSAATLSATADGGNLVVWFDSETATQHIATGTEFTTPGLTQAVSYWVAAYNPQTHCISARTRLNIVVTPNIAPVVEFSYAADIYCGTAQNPLPVTAGGFNTGGSFGSEAGLSVDAETGEIDLRNSQPGTYTIVYEVAEDTDSCLASGRYEAQVTIETCGDIQRGISPNGDEYNQYFDLTGMNISKLSIFNRYGTEVYGAVNYVKEWEGQDSSGNELPTGTYFYAIEKKDGAQLTGWVYINRK